MNVLDKINNRLNETTTGRVDISVQSVGTQSLVKIWMGVYSDTSVKELQKAERILLKKQKAMVKTLETTTKKLGNDWRMEPQTTAWVQKNDGVPVATPLLITAYITIYNTQGPMDATTINHMLDKHRG